MVELMPQSRVLVVFMQMAAQPFCSCSRSVVGAQSPHARQAQSPPTRLALQPRQRDAIESSDCWLLPEISEVGPPSELRDLCGFALRGVPTLMGPDSPCAALTETV